MNSNGNERSQKHEKHYIHTIAAHIHKQEHDARSSQIHDYEIKMSTTVHPKS